MGPLFKAKTPIDGDDPYKKLTRFKRMHVRETSPQPEVDCGIDPVGQLSRSTRTHVREQPTPKAFSFVEPRASKPPISFVEPETVQKPIKGNAADLHASDPISIDVLHRALPLRASQINDQHG